MPNGSGLDYQAVFGWFFGAWAAILSWVGKRVFGKLDALESNKADNKTVEELLQLLKDASIKADKDRACHMELLRKHSAKIEQQMAENRREVLRVVEMVVKK